MSRELPFPITFALPQRWSLVSPDRHGQPDAAYVAVRETANGDDPVATNIVVTGLGLHDVTLDVAALADAKVSALHAKYPVTILKRDVLNTGPAGLIAHLLQISYPTGDSTTTLRQIRLVSAFTGIDDPADIAVIEFVTTCPAELFEQAGAEFMQFVGSVAVAAGDDPASESNPATAAHQYR
jgi:hypothetical protein